MTLGSTVFIWEWDMLQKFGFIFGYIGKVDPQNSLFGYGMSQCQI